MLTIDRLFDSFLALHRATRTPTKAERKRARLRLQAAKLISADRGGRATCRLLLVIHRALREIHAPGRA